VNILDRADEGQGLLLCHHRFVRGSRLWHLQILSGVIGQELLLLGHVSDCIAVFESFAHKTEVYVLINHMKIAQFVLSFSTPMPDIVNQ